MSRVAAHVQMPLTSLYRFDGWRKVRDDAGTTTGGGQWTKDRAEGHPARGAKSVWVWDYP